MTTTEIKRCYRCGEEKPLDEFYRDRSKHNGASSACKPCAKRITRENNAKDPERRRTYQRDYYQRNRETFRERNLERLYGLTASDFDAMLAAQGGGCAICGSEERLHVDHCHETGRVRGILCSGCNRGVGFFNDNPEKLLSAAEYLRD